MRNEHDAVGGYIESFGDNSVVVEISGVHIVFMISIPQRVELRSRIAYTGDSAPNRFHSMLISVSKVILSLG